jgi:hypothetical protein
MRIETMGYAAKFAFVTLALVVGIALMSPARAAGSVDCYPDWSDAALIVARERLMPANEVQAMTRRHLAGDVIRLTLCRSATGYIYRIVFRDDRGRLKKLVITANRPDTTDTIARSSMVCSVAQQLQSGNEAKDDLCQQAKLPLDATIGPKMFRESSPEE